MGRVVRYLVVLLSVLAFAFGPGLTVAAADGTGDCTAWRPTVPGARVESVTAGVVTAKPGSGLPDYCDVRLQLTHPGDHDDVRVQVWLPLQGWNGRFQGTGGAGYGVGNFGYALPQAISAGYAAAATDGGIPPDLGGPPTWALTERGQLNRGLLSNFAHRSVHDMTVAAKAITARFYGRQATYSYWNGCSGGGRQGLMEAQRYPGDYDGILAGAPGINWPRFLTAAQWPQVVMQQERTFPSQCEFATVQAAAVHACDPLDGVRDGLLEQPQRCHFDPRKLIGRTVLCAGERRTISAADAAVVRRIWDGPRGTHGERLWPGLTKGASFDMLAATVTRLDGSSTGAPFYLPDTWIRYFVKQDPGFDTAKVGYREFAALFREAFRKYNRILGTDDPNLSRFAASGGKLLVWHGSADELVPAAGSVDYRQRVQRRMSNVDGFFRLFLAPGVAHCGGGTGPAPTDPLGALVDWVERGKPPATLPAASGTATRNLCRFPLVSTYDGHGDPNSASSFRCTRPER